LNEGFSNKEHTFATRTLRKTRDPRRHLAGIALATLVIMHTLSGSVAANEAPLAEDELKAAFMYKFAHFVTWPTGSKRDVIFCVTGRKSFQRSLRATIEKLNSSPIESRIHYIEPADDTSTCSMLFVAESMNGRVEDSLRKVGSQPILTIGESRGFAHRGGMINFAWEGRRIRLEINRAAVEASGLVISSHVLKLARLVGKDSR
jgi:hypothetical protein